jgi:hypothetical protein
MPERHSWFVHAENLKDFQLRLALETEPTKRRSLEKLITEEEAALKRSTPYSGPLKPQPPDSS